MPENDDRIESEAYMFPPSPSSTPWAPSWVPDAWPGWRAEKKRAHVFAQFDAARAVYRRFARESVD